ncbi:hypothetical protein BJ138DRAFT_97953 [Hygrophoropsis aurantiaca]|uniref:Uncharacterized protein n=1 Tax=Hygrophoropsis aurantiaca TaxID=72124 RepID=A0ACB7ZS69_9AGAM|nr:hypothetical protein BJ138DRAFT_97953 [Hygrophoropsis aurantiaca]
MGDKRKGKKKAVVKPTTKGTPSAPRKAKAKAEPPPKEVDPKPRTRPRPRPITKKSEQTQQSSPEPKDKNAVRATAAKPLDLDDVHAAAVLLALQGQRHPPVSGPSRQTEIYELEDSEESEDGDELENEDVEGNDTSNGVEFPSDNEVDAIDRILGFNSKDDIESSDSQDEDYEIIFEVPCGEALKEVPLMISPKVDNISWSQARTRFTDKMMRDPARVQLGYVLPWKWPRSAKPVPTALESDIDWNRLLEYIDNYREAELAKRSNKGVVKAFSVSIVEIGGQATIPTKGGKATKSSSKGGASKSNKAIADENGSDDERSEKPVGIHRIIGEITRVHHCNKCEKPCYIDPGPPVVHKPYSMPQLATWASLVQATKASVNTVPAVALGLPTKKKEEIPQSDKTDDGTGKNANPSTAQTAGVFPFQPQITPMTPTTMPVYGGNTYPYASQMMAMSPPMLHPPQIPLMPGPGMFPMPFPPYQSIVNPYSAGSFPGMKGFSHDSSPTPTTPKKNRHRRQHEGGSLSGDESAVAVDYPSLEEWLASLDNDHVRGRDGQYYTEWTEDMYRHGILRLDDLDRIQQDRLQYLTQMNEGTAGRIKTWAAMDCKELVRAARKRKEKRHRFD